MSSKKPVHHPFKRVFFTGVLVTFPTILTLFLFYWLADMIDKVGAAAIHSVYPAFSEFRGLGFVCVLAIIFSVGLVTSNYFGKKIYELYEFLFTKIPGFNRVFSLFKKLTSAAATGLRQRRTQKKYI